MIETFTNESILILTLRIILGSMFLIQGYDKVVRVKLPGVIQAFKFEFGEIKIPNFIVALGAYLSSYIELICGLMLILGLITQYALFLLGLDLILVSFALSIITPAWDMAIVFPRLVVWSILMYLPRTIDLFCLDHFLAR
jgi:putative oxidoreductase